MRIALLHPTYWPEVRRGAERLVHDLAGWLAKEGHDVTILTTHREKTSTADEDGVRVVRMWRAPDALFERRAYELRVVGVVFEVQNAKHVASSSRPRVRPTLRTYRRKPDRSASDDV